MLMMLRGREVSWLGIIFRGDLFAVLYKSQSWYSPVSGDMRLMRFLLNIVG